MKGSGSGILFVDDDRRILAMVQEYLTEVGYAVDVVDNGAQALDLIRDRSFEIVFTDIKMPDFDGLELLSAIKEFRPDIEVIIVTGHGSMESAIQAMKQGSYDYLQKPFKLSVLKTLIDRILEDKKRKQEKTVQRTRVRARSRYDALIGISACMQQIYDRLDQIRSKSSNVLIQGESGTGKELAAQVIYRTGVLSQRPFVAVSCSSLLRGLAEERHPERLRDVLASAQQGTLFMNEICDLPAPAQADLAGILREANGPNAPPRLAARVIAATNRDLDEAQRKGLLDKDLAGALSDAVVQMPPLRERKEDICLLILHFLHQFNVGKEKPVLAVSPDAMSYLLDYDWPGNVIQLENVIERALALGVESVIQIDDLPAEIRTAGEISRMQ
jgi:DNA-binding NtrC family response regulator